MVKKSRVEKSGVEKFMIEMSEVDKFMVKKSGVEKFFLALGLKCPVLKLGVVKSGVEMSFNNENCFRKHLNPLFIADSLAYCIRILWSSMN